ncbi:AvaI/BsoBI family type II restriction endonuclease [Cyanobacterium aponinum UTEX 3222]|uniref:AvaI/BsoBI family type II restriction endonuclease n=1 Tax=Cyanobacterium aponinum TaxID=379064 RepID=UPI002B4BEAC4|nr:AvaI/BsoBI family type II restriction endonuclease [Cyanobacterium aponinum]WRL39126.1 AvaI/BsoBI family type II restriction endonuclease [Cyanobacterium aponinum UTEX 3221]WRL40567.1 AvaI/BsoBI family type II restriction endonuclease [Cyanobacterium aponinum UTEX 3222]
MNYKNHLESFESLITPYEETRAGFIALALEKNKQATPLIEEAKVLKSIAQQAKTPQDLLNFTQIYNSLITASGISEKASKYFSDEDKKEAIKSLINNFLEPAGLSFIDELIYRFLLSKGDSLGGIMRNLGGKIGEWKFTRILLSTLFILGIDFQYLDANTKTWLVASNELDLEKKVKGLYWNSNNNHRILLYNLNIPIVNKNVDLSLLNASPDEIFLTKNQTQSAHYKAEKFIALGELKGGIDPAGADEHWKTANSALNRIRNSFDQCHYNPNTFFIGAAIESAMAKEIYQQLEAKTLNNCANLTNENHVVSLCNWLINL